MFDDPGEKSPHEPEEFDPDSLGPSPPEVPDISDRATDVDPEVRTLFWWLVVVFNVALMAVSVGLLFVAFRSNTVLGGQLVAAGFVLGGYGYIRYRRFRRQ